MTYLNLNVCVAWKVGHSLTQVPDDFVLHPDIKRLLEQRRKALDSGKGSRSVYLFTFTSFLTALLFYFLPSTISFFHLHFFLTSIFIFFPSLLPSQPPSYPPFLLPSYSLILPPSSPPSILLTLPLYLHPFPPHFHVFIHSSHPLTLLLPSLSLTLPHHLSPSYPPSLFTLLMSVYGLCWESCIRMFDEQIFSRSSSWIKRSP